MLGNKYYHYEGLLIHFLKRRSVTLLRYALAIIFFWYGMIKVLGISPIEELVHRATSWLGVHNFVIVLGVWEVLIGICLFVKKWNRLGLLLMFMQFPGTFLPLFTNPEDCFTIFPFGLTLEGQYIFKNLVLIAAGLVVITSLQQRSQGKTNH